MKGYLYGLLCQNLLLISLGGFAATDMIPLAQQPISTTAQSPPNILFMIDTSGSMNDPANSQSNQSRLSLSKAVVNDLLDGLTQVRVGLATFNASANGALIQVGINNIENNIGLMTSRLNALTANGGTPLAGSQLNMARYFVQGSNQTLTLHPNQSNQSTQSAYSIFNLSPVYSSGVTALSPIQSFCQRSFIIFLTDGEPSANDPQPSSSTGLTNYICTTLGGFPCGLVNTAAAMYQMDLRPDLTDPDGGAKKNNVVTYTIGFDSISANGKALLKATAENAGGVFFTASNANDLSVAFQSVTASILYQSVSAAAIAFNTTSLSSDTAIYQAQYRSTDWSGQLFKYPVNTDGSLGVASWEAGEKLANIPFAQRLVLTYNADNKLPVLFKTLSALSLAQQCDLKANSTSATCNSTEGQSRLNYLLGDRSNEQTSTNKTLPYRQRQSLLGDIVDSSPVYVGEASSAWTDQAPFPTTGNNRYSVFKQGIAATRTPVVYVGANDGMLHGFNALTGAEVMAYVPAVLSQAFQNGQPNNGTSATIGLHYYTSPSYAHRFYVNGSPSIQDVYIKTRSSSIPSWRTILVGGLAAGGKGYYALDVTNPGVYSAANINQMFLWEFSSQDTKEKASDPELLGYTYSQPQLVLMNNGRWAAIFGNGYNTTGTDDAELFIVYLDGGLDGQWTRGSDYLVINTDSGKSVDDNAPNALSTPAAVDLDGNGTVDRVYAGDLNGDLWAFDVSSTQASQWKSAYGSTSNPKPLYQGLSSQPITAQPVVAKNPVMSTNSGTQPNVLVLFGTGRLINTLDKANTEMQSFYGIWDSGEDRLTRRDLVQQTYTTAGAFRVMSDKPVPYSASHSNAVRFGWMIDFIGGERILSSASIVNVPITAAEFEPLVIFNTYAPNTSDQLCQFGGSATTMLVKLENGGQPTIPIIDTNNDNQITPLDNWNNQVVSGMTITNTLPSQPIIRGDYLFIPLSEGKVMKIKIMNSGYPLGRWSWNLMKQVL